MADFMEQFLSNIIGYCMIFTCAAMCYMPMTKRIKISEKRLFTVAVVVISLFVIIFSLISSSFGIEQNAIIIPASVIFFVIYYKTLNADIFECLFVFMFVTSISRYPYHYALYLDAMINPEGSHKLFPIGTEIFQEVLFLVLVIIFFFIRKYIAEFIDNLEKVSLKKILWTIPCFFTAVLLYVIPLNYETIYTGRMIQLYPIVIMLLFILEIIIVYLLIRISHEIMNNEKLERENQILEFQSKRYESFKKHIEQTARIRHDFRQQLRTISSFAESGKYDDLKKFLSEYTGNLAGMEWESYCQNSAVDAIAGYYSLAAKQNGIITDWRIELPNELPLSENIFCGMLGNLIENSINGCETLSGSEKIIHLSVQMPSSSMLALVIENSFNGEIKIDKKGEIMSSNHKGTGMGLHSVRTVAEKYHGRMQVYYDDKTFRVSILLNF